MAEQLRRLPLRRRPVQGICAMDVGEDVLGLILERVDSVVSLVRAASVCKRWRRAIADAAFLRCFRSLHPQVVAGYYYNGGTRVPSPASGVGAAPTEREGTGRGFVPSSPSMDARHFSLDFLPDRPDSWNIVDSRGSLLLMQRWVDGNRLGRFPDLVVCEPFARRYRRVPLPPVEDFDKYCLFMRPFLIDGVMDQTGNCISLSNFRMLCWIQCNRVFRTAVFTASDEFNCSWRKMATSQVMPMIGTPIGCAGGSWYFYKQGSMLIVLDRGTGEFSASMLPVMEHWNVNLWSRNFTIIEGRDGNPRMLTMFDDNMKVFARLDGGEWGLEKRVLLSEVTRSLPGYQPSFFSHPPKFLTIGVGFIILSPNLLPSGEQWAFSLDLETMEATPAVKGMGFFVYQLEFPWPPSLHTCLD